MLAFWPTDNLTSLIRSGSYRTQRLAPSGAKPAACLQTLVADELLA